MLDAENAAVAGKALGKKVANNTRATLANISNRNVVPTNADTKKVMVPIPKLVLY